MPGEDKKALEREVSATPAEFAHGLRNAFPDGLTGGPVEFRVDDGAAAMEIHLVPGPDRVIALLRDPVDLVESLHSQLLYSGEEDLPDLGLALAAEADRRQGRRIPPSTHAGLEAPPDEALLYRRVVDFAPQVRRWRQAFGAERVRVLLHDALKAEPAATWARVVDFIGADPSFTPDFGVVNPNKRARSQAARKLIQGLRWGPWNRLVPKGRLRTAIRRGFERLQAANTKVEARQALDPALRERLLVELEPGIAALEAELGRPLPAWRT